MDPARRASLAVQRCRTRRAPDERVAVYDLRVESGPLSLTGVVSSDRFRRHALAAARAAVDEPVSADVTVLDAIGSPVTTPERILPVRSDPDADAERVTELRYGASATAYDAAGGWRRVRVPDGYFGWVDDRGLRDPVPFDADGFVTTDDLTVGGVCLPRSTECEVLGDGRVRFRTGAEVAVDSEVVEAGGAVQSPTGESIVAQARQYLGTPYRWGGASEAGIDCSGLVWVAYFRNGVVLPRDADQQRSIGDPVERDHLEPGDLLFFPGHVAISTGGRSFVHASGSADAVTENSLDPTAADYVADLDDAFECARRVL